MNLQKPEVERHDANFWLDAIAADNGAEEASIVQDEISTTTIEEPIEEVFTQPEIEDRYKRKEEPKVTETKPQDPTPKVEEPVAKIEIEDIFADEVPDYQPTAKTEAQLEREIEEKVQRKFQALLEEYEIVEEGDDGQEVSRPLRKEDNTPDVRKAIREEMAMIRQQERIEAENRNIEQRYKENFQKSLEKQNVQLSKIEKQYVVEGIEKGKIHLMRQLGRNYLYPNELIEVTRWHRTQMQDILNDRGYTPATPKQTAQNLSPITKADLQKSPVKQEAPITQQIQINTLDDVNREAARLQQIQGDLLPSQVSALQKHVMRINGAKKMKF